MNAESRIKEFLREEHRGKESQGGTKDLKIKKVDREEKNFSVTEESDNRKFTFPGGTAITRVR